MKIKSIKIVTLLKFSFVFSMFLVVFLGLVSYFQSNELHKTTEEMYNHPFVVERAINKLKSDIVALHRDMKDLSLATDSVDIKVEKDWVKWWKKEGYEQIDIIYNQYLGPRNDVDTLKQYFDTLNNVCEKTIELMLSGNADNVYSRTKTFGIIGYKVEAVLEKLQTVNDFAINKGNELHLQSLNLNNSLNRQLIILVAIILLFLLIVNIVLYRSISRPIKELINATHRFNKGDRPVFSSYVSQNEFGELSASFNDMVTLIKLQSEEKEKKAEEFGIVNGKAQENEAINEELLHINEELFSAKEKADESNRFKTAFLANMSHEIRTPMNGIVGFAELLKKDNLKPETQLQYVEIINHSANRLLGIINDIIDISKIETGQIELNESECDISYLIKKLNEVYLLQAREKGIKLTAVCNCKACYVLTDELRIYQIINNLLSNALKFTSSGEINLNCEISADGIFLLKISDTGMGISAEEMPHIFDRFWRAEKDTLKPGTAGSGLGLAISKALTEMMGGKVQVTSVLGKGSEFIVEIPLKTAGVKPDINIAPASNVEINFNNLKLLVAEDDDVNYFYLESLLEETGVFLVRAVTGLEVIDIFKANNFIDIVIMDIRMPVMDGLQSMKMIKKINPDVPVIAFTAYALLGDETKLLQSGFDSYISKPTTKRILFETINKMLRR